MEISCRLNAAMSASGNHRYGNEGTNGTGAHPHNFTHSHMASDAPQPQITGPRKHPEAETPFFCQKLYTVRKYCGSLESGEGHQSRVSEEKSSPFEI